MGFAGAHPPYANGQRSNRFGITSGIEATDEEGRIPERAETAAVRGPTRPRWRIDAQEGRERETCDATQEAGVMSR